MRRPTSSVFSNTIVLTGVLLISSLMVAWNPSVPPNTDSSEELGGTLAQFFGAGSTDMNSDCSGYSFEDLFAYSHAIYRVSINDEWDGGYLEAVAWINGSFASELRTDLDSLFDGLPGGNNSYLSTDERDALLHPDTGPRCVSETDFRFGMTSINHRGDSNWGNFSWIREGMELGETNGVPEDHPDRRNCLSGSIGCYEIPVSAEDDMILYLNSSLDHEGLMDVTDFTFGLQATLLDSTKIVITFPDTDNPQRLIDGQVSLDCNATYTDSENVTFEPRPECVSYHYGLEHINSESRLLEGGEVEFTLNIDYPMLEWPAAMQYFWDMTDEELIVDNPPEWTQAAPADGTVFSAKGGIGEEMIFSGDAISLWGEDDGGLVGLDCDGGEGWNPVKNGSDWFVNPSEEVVDSSITCHLTDGGLSSNASRQWTLARPFTSISTPEGEVGANVNVTVNPSSTFDGAELVVSLLQDDVEVSSSPVTLSGVETVVALATTTLNPGDVSIKVTISGVGFQSWNAIYDFSITKGSRAPTVLIEGGSWEGGNYLLHGRASDPDGDVPQLTLEIDGSVGGSVNLVNTVWEVTVPLDLYESGYHSLNIIACDPQGVCSNASTEVDNSFLFGNGGDGDGTNPAGNSDEGEGSNLMLLVGGGGGLLLLVIIIMLFMRKGKGDEQFAQVPSHAPTMAPTMAPTVDPMEAYVHQLMAQGYTEQQARAYATQHQQG